MSPNFYYDSNTMAATNGVKLQDHQEHLSSLQILSGGSCCLFTFFPHVDISVL